MIKRICYIIHFLIFSLLLCSSCSAYSINSAATSLEAKCEKMIEAPELVKVDARESTSLQLRVNTRIKFTSNFISYTFHRVIIKRGNAFSSYIEYEHLSSTNLPLYLANRNLLI